MNGIQNVDYEKMKLHFTFVYFGYYNIFVRSKTQTRYALDQKKSRFIAKEINFCARSLLRTNVSGTNSDLCSPKL